MDDDWDLHAVVRGCCTATTASATTTAIPVFSETCSSTQSHECLHVRPSSCSSTSPCFDFKPVKKDVELPDLFKELHELYKPFFVPKSEPLILQSAAVSPVPAFDGPSNGRLPLKRPHPEPSPVVPATNYGSASQTSRTKRRYAGKQNRNFCFYFGVNLKMDSTNFSRPGGDWIKGIDLRFSVECFGSKF